MKNCVYKLLLYITLIGVFFNAFLLLYRFSDSVDRLTYLSEPSPVSNTDKLYALENKFVLVHNPICGIFQCFDFDGNFVWGIHLPTTKNMDGTLVSYNKNKLYIWEGKSNTVYIYENFKFISKETNDKILWRENFYSYYPTEFNNQYNCRFNWNGIVNIKDINTNTKEIKLNTEFINYTYIHAFVGMVLCGLCFLFLKKYKLQ